MGEEQGDFIEALLHTGYFGAVFVESDHSYRWAAAGLLVMTLFHLWRNKSRYIGYFKHKGSG